MNVSLSFVRIFFIGFSALFLTLYTTTLASEGPTSVNLATGMIAALSLSIACIATEYLFKRSNLRAFNIAVLGLLFGYFMAEAIMLFFNTLLINHLTVSSEHLGLIKMGIYLFCGYLGMTMTARVADDFSLTIPFIKLKATSPNKKDLLTDWTILMDSRILDLASSGLLDNHLIVPRFMLKELYMMLESGDETIKNKARRCLDVFKKLEGIPSLELRFSDTDFPEIKDPSIKLLQLARLLDANIITADVARLQNYAVDGIRIINIHLLSNALKPINGEFLTIKIQRYGKEPRQGVGYLEDGTMVVVNGGAEYIGDTIKAQVLSAKHTASGRMIFCNAMDDENMFLEPSLSHANGIEELESAHKNYFAL